MEISKAGFYKSYYEAAKQIENDSDRLAFYEAILGYMFEGTEPAGLSPLANIAFIAIRPNIDAELKRKRGGAPAGNCNARKYEAATQEEETAEEPKPAKAPAKKRFEKPTLQQIQDYCKERNNQVNAQQFLDFYEAKGWKVGREAMKDWKACIRTWEQRDRSPRFPVYGQRSQLPPDRLEL